VRRCCVCTAWGVGVGGAHTHTCRHTSTHLCTHAHAHARTYRQMHAHRADRAQPTYLCVARDARRAHAHMTAHTRVHTHTHMHKYAHGRQHMASLPAHCARKPGMPARQSPAQPSLHAGWWGCDGAHGGGPGAVCARWPGPRALSCQRGEGGLR